MSAPTTPAGIVNKAVTDSDAKAEVMTIAGAGLGIGVLLFAVRKGWRTFRGLA